MWVAVRCFKKTPTQAKAVQHFDFTGADTSRSPLDSHGSCNRYVHLAGATVSMVAHVLLKLLHLPAPLRTETARTGLLLERSFKNPQNSARYVAAYRAKDDKCRRGATVQDTQSETAQRVYSYGIKPTVCKGISQRTTKWLVKPNSGQWSGLRRHMHLHWCHIISFQFSLSDHRRTAKNCS